jgi:hypothetical protein
MFSNYEALQCAKCETAFSGRRPAIGGLILCLECLSAKALPVVNEGDPCPASVMDEISGGKGAENE